MNRKDTALLRGLGACDESLRWYRTMPDLETAWQTCQRPDWMMWSLRQIGYKDNKVLRLYACACIRGTPIGDDKTVRDLLTDPRSHAAIGVAEKYANGQATGEELKAAHIVAQAAADAVGSVVRDSTWAAAWGVIDVTEANPWNAALAVYDVACAAAEAAVNDKAVGTAWAATKAAAEASGWRVIDATKAAVKAAKAASKSAKAARDAAWNVARVWQSDKLREFVRWEDIKESYEALRDG